MTLIEDALTQIDSVSVIKHELPTAFVLSYIGLNPYQSSNRVQCSCPFHRDKNPSFDVWREDDGTERWGCWPCGLRGDVIDLVRLLWESTSFGGALENCLSLRDSCKQSGWRGPEPELSKHEWDESQMLTFLWKAQRDFSSSEVESLILQKNWSFDAEHLRDLGCGVSEDRLVIPYFNQKEDLVAIKHRSLRGDDRPISLPGSRLRDTLYLENRGIRSAPTIVVVEGESDAWTATWAIWDLDLRVLGLPSGAGSPVQPFISRLRDHRVFLAFDGDEAGWAGEQRWLRAINDSGGWAVSLGIPAGQDVVSLGQGEFRALVEKAVS